MAQFSLSDRYRLELHWKEAIYEQEGVCKLIGACFSGPALAEALKINDNDHILIDFFRQYMVLVNNVYVAKFSWGAVEYLPNNTVALKDALITHNTELNKVPNLSNTDYLIIDTVDHELERHQFHLVYKTYVVNAGTELYKFRRN